MKRIVLILIILISTMLLISLSIIEEYHKEYYISFYQNNKYYRIDPVINIKNSEVFYKIENKVLWADYDEKYIYIVDEYDTIYCIEINTKKLKWKKKYNKTNYKRSINFLLIDENILYIRTKDALYALNKGNGKIIWEGKYGLTRIYKNYVIFVSFKYVYYIDKMTGELKEKVQYNNIKKISGILSYSYKNLLVIKIEDGSYENYNVRIRVFDLEKKKVISKIDDDYLSDWWMISGKDDSIYFYGMDYDTWIYEYSIRTGKLKRKVNLKELKSYVAYLIITDKYAIIMDESLYITCYTKDFKKMLWQYPYKNNEQYQNYLYSVYKDIAYVLHFKKENDRQIRKLLLFDIKTGKVIKKIDLLHKDKDRTPWKLLIIDKKIYLYSNKKHIIYTYY